MDFDLPAEHALLRDTIRDFMPTEVAPVVDEHERERRFPADIVRRIGELGWLGIPIPEDEGGAGLDTLAYAIAIEEIGRVWGSLGLIVAAHTSLGCGPLHLAGTRRAEAALPRPDGQRQGARRLRADRARRRLRRRRHAHDRAPRRRRVGASTAPSGSSPTPARPARTSSPPGPARPTRATPRSARSSCRPTRPGFSVGRLEDKLGLHASATGELRFDGARIPADNLLGTEGDGFRTFLKILDGGRISIGALAVGLAQAALDASIPYAQTREQFGRPIGTFQGVAFMVADMATEIEAARSLVWKSAWLKDQGRDYGLVAAEAKLFASEVSSRATNAAIQIHGGYGYVTDYPVERFLRDAKLTEIGEGTSQVQRLVIARRILGLRVV